MVDKTSSISWNRELETENRELPSKRETAGCATGSSRAGGLNLQLRCSI
jgi:hypothetical protein